MNHQCPDIPYLIAPRLCDLILGNRIQWKWVFVYKVRDIMGYFLLFLDHLLQRKLAVTLCACIFGKKPGFHTNNHLLHVHRWLIHKHIDYKLMKGSNLDSHIYTVFRLQALHYFQVLIFGSSLLHYNRLYRQYNWPCLRDCTAVRTLMLEWRYIKVSCNRETSGSNLGKSVFTELMGEPTVIYLIPRCL